jgi:hypothetical protein
MFDWLYVYANEQIVLALPTFSNVHITYMSLKYNFEFCIFGFILELS